MFLTYNRTTGQPLQVVQADPSEGDHYATEEVGVIPLEEGWPEGLNSSYVTPEGALSPLPQPPSEGACLWDWDTHTWKEVVQAEPTASEVKA